MWFWRTFSFSNIGSIGNVLQTFYRQSQFSNAIRRLSGKFVDKHNLAFNRQNVFLDILKWIWDLYLISIIIEILKLQPFLQRIVCSGGTLKDRSHAFSFRIYFFQIWDNALNLNIMKFHCNLCYCYQLKFWDFQTFWNCRTANFYHSLIGTEIPFLQ